MTKYAILDRDGTIIWEPEKPGGVDSRETFPLKSADQVSFIDGAIEGMKKLKEKGYKLILATNQTFLGTEKHPQDIFDSVMDKMFSDLKKENINFEFVMICPHSPDEGCNCRKPAIGGLEEVTTKEDFDVSNSIMFGDRDSDKEFAKNLGIRFQKVETNGKFQLPENL